MELERDQTAGFWFVPSRYRLVDLRHFYENTFYDSAKPGYLTKVREELDYWRDIASWRLRLIERVLEKTGRILDVGAGAGVLLDVARRRGWCVRGVEPSVIAAAFAAEQLDLHLYRGFIEDYTDEPFDVVYASFVLEHIADPWSCMNRLRSLTKPQGLVWIEVPNDFNRMQLAVQRELAKDPWWIVPGHHLNYFDFNSLGTLLEQSGFSVVERLASFPMEWFPLMGLDYIGHDEVGAQCHTMRMRFEQHLLKQDSEVLHLLYTKLAEAGLGRSCNIIARAV